MGVYGTSAPLDSFDIDYDDGEESYLECSNCQDEYTEGELFTRQIGGAWYENVCEDCYEAYEKRLKELIEEAHEQVEEEWDSGHILKASW